MIDANTGVISTIAGTGSGGYSGVGGAATSAQLNDPAGVALDSSGNVYIADNNNHRIRMITVYTSAPSSIPTSQPSLIPSALPTSIPSKMPTTVPSKMPSNLPTSVPSITPSSVPTWIPTSQPSSIPTVIPTNQPTEVPSRRPHPRRPRLRRRRLDTVVHGDAVVEASPSSPKSIIMSPKNLTNSTENYIFTIYNRYRIVSGSPPPPPLSSSSASSSAASGVVGGEFWVFGPGVSRPRGGVRWGSVGEWLCLRPRSSPKNVPAV